MEQDVNENDLLKLRFKYYAFYDLNRNVVFFVFLLGSNELSLFSVGFLSIDWFEPYKSYLWTGQVVYT